TVHAEGSAALHPAVDNSVSRQDQALAGAELAAGGRKACPVPADPERCVLWRLELAELALGVDQVGVGMAAVDPRKGGGRRAPARHPCGDVEVGIVQATDSFVDQANRVLEVLAASPRGA